MVNKIRLRPNRQSELKEKISGYRLKYRRDLILTGDSGRKQDTIWAPHLTEKNSNRKIKLRLFD